MRYPVTTPEDTIDVQVVFMDSVISHGWEGYATCDTYYPGGWATSDALYCVRDSYDLESEAFLVSYLKHEGKHFADYKRFPKLASPDLEYRAKLAELAEARTTTHRLLRFLMRNSAPDPANGHAFANHCLVRDLSRMLFDKDREDDPAAWEQVPVERIQQASRELLLQNTQDMVAAGAAEVERFIR